VHQVLVGLLAGGLLLSALLTWHIDFDVRGSSPDWADQIRAARTACADGRPATRVYFAPHLIVTDGSPEWWWTDMPCAELLP
jgi:hypothetical protein